MTIHHPEGQARQLSAGMRSHSTFFGPLRAIVLDWAGTTVDFGSFAPTAVFLRLFADEGVAITAVQARSGMGLMKKDHLRTIFALPAVGEAWQAVHGSQPSEADVERLFARFEPLQIDCIADYAQPVPGLHEALDAFRVRGLRVGATTGYTRSMMEALAPRAAEYGYIPDAWVSATDTPAGRPYPWMIYRVATELGVFPMAGVVKVGDTLPDIEEGLNAGTWTVALALSGNLLGLTLEEFGRLSPDEVASHRTVISARLLDAGAHYVVDTIAQVPAVLDEIDARLASGECP